MSTAPVPYITLADITSSSWSLELDQTANEGSGSGLGKVVQAFDDIHQCLQIILTTVPGEDCFRPTFGCDLFQFLDMPMPAAIPAIVAAVTSAITTWEPRIQLQGVSATADPTKIGHLIVAVVWVPDLALINQANTTIGGTSQTTLVSV